MIASIEAPEVQQALVMMISTESAPTKGAAIPRRYWNMIVVNT